MLKLIINYFYLLFYLIRNYITKNMMYSMITYIKLKMEKNKLILTNLKELEK